jgi:predicted glutamine amidotransferase
MCGLVGIMSSNMLQKHKDCLATMLYLDTFRGRDSTGVAAIRHNADTAILKQTVPGYEFTEGPKLAEHLKLNDFVWIGHNRAGTIGKNIKTNAHPFAIDDEDGGCLVVGAHNGTLKNKHALTDHNRFGTDSEALYNEIAINGVKAAIAKAEGAWALTYYDHIAEELRIVRNKERTLFYAWSDDKKTLFWASEIWMIKVATSRSDLKLHEDKVYAFTEDTLYKIPAPTKYNEELTIEREGGVVGKQTAGFFQPTGGRGGPNNTTNPHPQGTSTTQTSSQSSTHPITGSYGNRTLEGKVYDSTRRMWVEKGTPPLTSTSPSGTPTSDSGEKQPPKSETGSTLALPDGTGNKVVSIDDARKTYKGYQGKALTLNQLRDDLDAGCSWCELEHIGVNDRFAWLAPGRPVCKKCLDGSHPAHEEPKAAVSIH